MHAGYARAALLLFRRKWCQPPSSGRSRQTHGASVSGRDGVGDVCVFTLLKAKNGIKICKGNTETGGKQAVNGSGRLAELVQGKYKLVLSLRVPTRSRLLLISVSVAS